MNIATLLSGGVDSAVVTHLLCEQGYAGDLWHGRTEADVCFKIRHTDSFMKGSLIYRIVITNISLSVPIRKGGPQRDNPLET